MVSGPGARGRILATAMRLFYSEGIRSVGIDRLISESSVTKATFYKHFGSKDALILAYVTAAHEQAVATLNALDAESDGGAKTLTALIEQIRIDVQQPDFRGCLFINAAVEFADASHPVRQMVLAHRDWYTAFLAELFRSAGHPMPGDGADEFVLLRDGAMMGAYVGDSIASSASLERFGSRVLDRLDA